MDRWFSCNIIVHPVIDPLGEDRSLHHCQSKAAESELRKKYLSCFNISLKDQRQLWEKVN